jgi:hypothetical protein
MARLQRWTAIKTIANRHRLPIIEDAGAGEHGIEASALANLDNLRVLVLIRARISVLMVKGALVKMTQPLRTATRTRTESERLDITIPDGQLSSSGARHHADATRCMEGSAR